MKKLVILLSTLLISGCAVVDTVKQYWPRDHDPAMFTQLVDLSIAIELMDCAAPQWALTQLAGERLARYAEWRHDPQADNLRGLQKHLKRMEAGGSKTFCEIGKRTAQQRIDAAKAAWEKR